MYGRYERLDTALPCDSWTTVLLNFKSVTSSIRPGHGCQPPVPRRYREVSPPVIMQSFQHPELPYRESNSLATPACISLYKGWLLPAASVDIADIICSNSRPISLSNDTLSVMVLLFMLA